MVNSYWEPFHMVGMISECTIFWIHFRGLRGFYQGNMGGFHQGLI